MKNIITLSVIALLVLGSLYIWDTPPQELINTEKNTPKNKIPNNFMTHIQAVSYNKSGLRDYSLQAPRLEQYDKQQQALATQPHFIFFSDNQADWQAQAEHGQVLKNGDLVKLQKKVKLWQNLDNNEIQELLTSQLNLKTKEKIAQTKKKVTIHNPSSTIIATGMNARLDNKALKLLSKVKSSHEVQ